MKSPHSPKKSAIIGQISRTNKNPASKRFTPGHSALSDFALIWPNSMWQQKQMVKKTKRRSLSWMRSPSVSKFGASDTSAVIGKRSEMMKKFLTMRMSFLRRLKLSTSCTLAKG